MYGTCLQNEFVSHYSFGVLSVKMGTAAALLCWFYLSGVVSGSSTFLCNIGMSRDNSQSECQIEGYSFLTELDIRRKGLHGMVMNDLRQTGSYQVWTGSIAKFSDFVMYRGCYEKTYSQVLHRQNRLVDNGVYHCYKHCTYNKHHTYFGLHGDECLCLDSVNPVGTNDSVCHETCDTYFKESCGDNNRSISVYEIVAEDSIGERVSEEEHHQCVLTKMKSDGRLQWKTHSCTSYCSHCGYICDLCKSPHSGASNSGEPCYNLVPGDFTWEEATSECRNYSGELLNPATANMSTLTAKDRDLLTKNFLWTGIFRTIDTESSSEPVDAAVSSCVYVARKSGRDSLLYEPSDCSRTRPFFCYSSTNAPRSATFCINPTTLRSSSQPTDANSSTLSSAFVLSTTTMATHDALEDNLLQRPEESRTRNKFPIWIVAVSAAFGVVMIASIVIASVQIYRKYHTIPTKPLSHGFADATRTGTNGEDFVADSTRPASGDLTDTRYVSLPSAAVECQYEAIPDAGLIPKLPESRPSPRKPERKSLRAKQGLLVQEAQPTRSSTEELQDNTYNMLNDIPRTLARENCNVYDHVINVKSSAEAESGAYESEDDYDHIGETENRSSGKWAEGPDLYSTTQNMDSNSLGTEGTEDIYDHTFDRVKQREPDSTYSHLTSI